MAIKPDYQAGLATLAAGGTTITFSGGANITAADIQPGDTFKVQNLDAIIASVTDATHVELTAPWTGAALTAAPYRVRFQPDGSRFTAALRDLVAAIGSGSVAALQALTGAADKIPYFTSAGVMALADFSANARATLANAKAWTESLFGLTMAADKLPYGTGANTMGLTDITAQGRTALANITAAGNALIDDADASAQLTTLGVTAYIKTLLDDANAAAVFTTLGGSSGTNWMKLPGGLIVQWGNSIVSPAGGGGGASVTLPTAFTSATSYAVSAMNGEQSSGPILLGGFPTAKTASGFLVVIKNSTTGATVANGGAYRVDWIAVGT